MRIVVSCMRRMESEGEGTGDGLSTSRRLRKYVLSNPYVWLVAVSYFFIFFVRAEMLSWSHVFLQEFRGNSNFESAFRVSGLEVGGLLGWLVSVWASTTYRGDCDVAHWCHRECGRILVCDGAMAIRALVGGILDRILHLRASDGGGIGGRGNCRSIGGPQYDWTTGMDRVRGRSGERISIDEVYRSVWLWCLFCSAAVVCCQGNNAAIANVEVGHEGKACRKAYGLPNTTPIRLIPMICSPATADQTLSCKMVDVSSPECVGSGYLSRMGAS